MFIAYSSVEICKVDKGWIPELSPTYYGENKWGYPKWDLKLEKRSLFSYLRKPGRWTERIQVV